MKSWLFMSALLLVLVGGCNTSPAVPGPAGPQGAQGAPAPDQGHDRDRARQDQAREDQARQDHQDQARQDQTPSCPAGEHVRTDNGRATCVRD